MAKKAPTKEEWVTLRPEIEMWYWKNQRTANWIAAELAKRGLKVTKRMLYSRFREWKLPRKYNVSKPRQLEGGAEDEHDGNEHSSTSENASENSLRNQRTDLVPSGDKSPFTSITVVGTPGDDYRLHQALTSVHNFLDDLTETGSWQLSASQQGVEMQRLVAQAHQAVGSQCRKNNQAGWDDLAKLENRVGNAMSNFCNGGMHPRVLTALLRLLVDCLTASEWESQVLGAVRGMYRKVSKIKLPLLHPVRLLCCVAMGKDRAGAFLRGLFELLKKRFYDRINDTDPDFVAREQIYGARVLASLGRTQEADERLGSIPADYDSRLQRTTIADYHRTAGYSKSNAGCLEAAQCHLEMSLGVSKSINDGNSENVGASIDNIAKEWFAERLGDVAKTAAMWSHISLSNVFRGLHNMPGCEYHAVAAVKVWESNAELNQSLSGVKIVGDLYHIYEEQGKTAEKESLRRQYARYFEATKDGD